MFFENLPSGQSNIRPSASSVRRIQEGGKKADEIKQMRENHHKKLEMPQAEAHINAALNDWPEKEVVKSPEQYKKRPLSTLLLEFFHSFFS
ncbi:hypothetical protein IPN35_00780 [Candidatus Peregrinibacteria bacterium]|nr:MAG: hypothetical protein IPN35_00780 [Candidatus Peregrinibacteria bacterium]